MTSPYFDSGNFDEATGDYTVPADGRYSIEVTLNYTTAPITATIGTAEPTIVVQRTSPTTDDLISGYFPVLNIDVALVLTIRAILGNGLVTLAGEVELAAGDVIGLFYVSDTLALTLNLGAAVSPGGPGIFWSILRMT